MLNKRALRALELPQAPKAAPAWQLTAGMGSAKGETVLQIAIWKPGKGKNLQTLFGVLYLGEKDWQTYLNGKWSRGNLDWALCGQGTFGGVPVLAAEGESRKLILDFVGGDNGKSIGKRICEYQDELRKDRNEQRRLEEIARRNEIWAAMPGEMPKDWVQDANDTALKDSVYLFFKNNKNGTSDAFCSSCGKITHFGSRLLHSANGWNKDKHRMRCVNCGRMGETKAAGRGHSGIVDYGDYLSVQAAPGGAIWCRHWTVRRVYPDGMAVGVTEGTENARYYFDPATKEALKWEPRLQYDRKNRWHHEWTQCRNIRMENPSCKTRIASDALKVLKKSGLKNYAAAKPYVREYGDYLTEYLSLCVKIPKIELLEKSGFERLIFGHLKYGGRNAINWRGKTLKEFFSGDNRAEIRAYRETGASERMILEYREMRSVINLPPTTGGVIKAHELHPVKAIIERAIKELGTEKRVFKYVRSQTKANKAREIDVLQTWKDYAYMAELLKVKIEGQAFTPPNIWKVHDEMVQLEQMQREEQELKRMEGEMQKENKKHLTQFEERLLVLEPYRFERGGLLIRPCESPAEMIREGVSLRHCVGTYVDRHARGSSNIFLIRHSEEPEVPYYTLELSADKTRVVQWYGYADNRTVPKDPAVAALIEAWMREVVEKHPKPLTQKQAAKMKEKTENAAKTQLKKKNAASSAA